MGIPSTQLFPIETSRLLIRQFEMTDTLAACGLFEPGESAPTERLTSWLEWTVASYRQYATLHQPPYGDYAVCLRSTQNLIGTIGIVPCLAPFKLLSAFRLPGESPSNYFTAEVGLHWEIDRSERQKGYAKEAASALIDRAFRLLNLNRFVATTERRNTASIALMKSLQMTVETARLGIGPPWFQVAGILNRATNL